MSYTEKHIGKLKKIDLQGKSIEEWCKDKCNELGIHELKSWNHSWREELDEYTEYCDRDFAVFKDSVYEIIHHKQLDECESICTFIKNDDDTIDYVVEFYNGGTCLSEILDENLCKDEHFENRNKD